MVAPRWFTKKRPLRPGSRRGAFEQLGGFIVISIDPLLFMPLDFCTKSLIPLRPRLFDVSVAGSCGKAAW